MVSSFRTTDGSLYDAYDATNGYDRAAVIRAASFISGASHAPAYANDGGYGNERASACRHISIRRTG